MITQKSMHCSSFYKKKWFHQFYNLNKKSFYDREKKILFLKSVS